MAAFAGTAFSLLLGVLPVTTFLIALVALDSYKLVRLRVVLLLLAAGCGVAFACMWINPWLKDLLGLSFARFSRFEAPLVEELLKGALVMTAIWRRRIGFLVDAAIWGFAVGAGFAAVENLYYLLVLEQPNLAVWTIRGFGTAIMHGGASAILAVVTKHLTDRFASVAPWFFLPGLAAAVLFHALFNHFYISPLLSTLALVVGLPVVFGGVYKVSEQATHRWLGVGFDSDQELLEVINRGKVSETRVGRYLRALQDRFPPETVVDMLCMIRLHLELSIRAKGQLLMRKAGFDPPADPDVADHLAELETLRKSVGPTGLIALHPIFNLSDKDLWQLHLLKAK